MYRWPVRVYYEDTDAQGIVYFANYLKYFERARTEWLRAKGVDQNRLRESENRLFVVAETSVQYLRPAKFDQALFATVEVASARRASFELRQQLLTDSAEPELLVDSQTKVACVRASDLRPAGLPRSLEL